MNLGDLEPQQTNDRNPSKMEGVDSLMNMYIFNHVIFRFRVNFKWKKTLMANVQQKMFNTKYVQLHTTDKLYVALLLVSVYHTFLSKSWFCKNNWIWGTTS